MSFMTGVFPPVEGDTGCQCRTCFRDRYKDDDRPFIMSRMFLCQTCGNKRCPHATDHRLECTGSNEPGQPGSFYS